MEPSHWRQRWSTPIRSKNPFKPDFEDLSNLFGPIEESSTPAKTPRARSANPFRSDEVCSTPLKSLELLTTLRTPSPANTTKAAVTPPLVRSSNPFRSNETLPRFYIPCHLRSQRRPIGKLKSWSSFPKISMANNHSKNI